MKLFMMLWLACACLGGQETPETVLRDFTDARLEKVVERDYVLERTTGKMRVSIEAMSEDEFAVFADLRKYQKESFKIISKSCQERRCYLTYSLGYRETNQGNVSGWLSEVRKIAELTWVEGKWLIADVSNLKTYHESSQAIEINP